MRVGVGAAFRSSRPAAAGARTGQAWFARLVVGAHLTAWWSAATSPALNCTFAWDRELKVLSFNRARVRAEACRRSASASITNERVATAFVPRRPRRRVTRANDARTHRFPTSRRGGLAGRDGAAGRGRRLGDRPPG